VNFLPTLLAITVAELPFNNYHKHLISSAAPSLVAQHQSRLSTQPLPPLFLSKCPARKTQAESNTSSALKNAQELLNTAERYGNPELLAGALFSLGNAYLELNQYALATENYQRLIRVARESNNLEFQGHAFYQIGRIHLYQCQYKQAISAYQQAAGLHQTNQGRSAGAFAQAQLGLVQLIDNQPTQAAQSFSTSIELFESVRSGLPDRFKISIFRRQMFAYQTLQYALVATGKSNTALEMSERGRARAFVELLGQRIQGMPQLDSPKLAEIQRIAREQNATLVEYSTIGGISSEGTGAADHAVLFIWVIKPTGEVTLRLADLTDLPSPLPQFVEEARNSIFKSKDETVNPNLQRLHRLLIQPIADLLPTDPNQHVVFIPQDALFLVPFAALQDQQGRYLVERHTIRTAPAIQVLDLTRRQRQQLQGRGSLVVGFPRSGLVIGNPSGVSPSLPEAEKEAIEVASLLGTRPLLGTEATKATVVKEMLKAKTIHLATHGWFENELGKGLKSYLSFAAAGADNGVLSADEIINLRLNASFAVLSACNSGRGEITGDGVVGLSRAFVAAGVPSLVISLWSLQDQPSVKSLMVQFYQNLKQNPDRAQALRQAMLSAIKQGTQPRDWAAFTLVGEAE
jgi:CHAT domain-containing protein